MLGTSSVDEPHESSVRNGPFWPKTATPIVEHFIPKLPRNRPTKTQQQSFPGFTTMTPPQPTLPHFRSRLPPSPLLPRFASVEEANVESGPTLGVAVMAWLFGLAGNITILFLRKRVTREQEGPFRKCMSGGGGTSGRGPMGYNAGAV